jgi:hypothetical protein
VGVLETSVVLVGACLAAKAVPPTRASLRDRAQRGPLSRCLTDVRAWLEEVAMSSKATQGTVLGLGGPMFERLLEE